jgi:hypothetical protein
MIIDKTHARLWPKNAFSLVPPVHRADLEGQQRVEGGPSPKRIAIVLKRAETGPTDWVLT